MHDKTILMIGCFDTKAEDFAFLYACLEALNVNIISINTGVRGEPNTFPVTIDAAAVARETDTTLAELQSTNHRSIVVEKMGQGAARVIARLMTKGKVDGAIGMGGGGGTFIVLSAMQAIPVGIPKFCLSTMAAKDLSRQVGAKDIVLMPSIVDIAGLNSVSRLLIQQAAAGLVGMARTEKVEQEKDLGSIAISMFGNTTPCVEKCTAVLKERGYEVLAFHAVGVGGQTMEALIREGFFVGVLDVTTTELADELCDGICSAGPKRLTAAAEIGIPQIVVPGCLDMVNYAHLDTVPDRYQNRQLYSWAPDVTLMRTNEMENHQLGKNIAEKLNNSKGPVTIVLPLQGISIVSSPGGVFHRPEVDQVLFETIQDHIRPDIPILKMKANINDEVFAQKLVETLLDQINNHSIKK